MRFLSRLVALALVAGTGLGLCRAEDKAEPLNVPPKGFTALFNGKDLENWQIVIPIVQRNKLKEKGEETYAAEVKKRNEKHLKHWVVKDGVIHYDGKGDSLQTIKDYGDFELLIDWKIAERGDSGLYLRGQPQIQIWDSDRAGGARGVDKHSGSGAMWNNSVKLTKEQAAAAGVDPKSRTPEQGKLAKEAIKAQQDGGKYPLLKADREPGEWNTFRIIMKGDLVTVYLNGKLVVDKKPLQNYFQRGMPLPKAGPIELQHHGDPLWFRNIYIKELKAE